MSDAFEYLIQVFVQFVNLPQFQPMLVRVPETATVSHAIEIVLSRLRSADGVHAALPSSHASHYALCRALGDGSVDHESFAPLDLTSVIRDAKLQFPYMLALIHVGADPHDRVAKYDAVDAALKKSQATRAAELSAAEREAAEARRAEVERLRLENIRKIEERRTQTDVARFHASESYEMQRREALAAQREQEKEEENAKLAQKLLQEARMQEAARRAADAQREELEAHRLRMLNLKEEEASRQDQARRTLAAQEAATVEAKRLAAEQRRRELDATRGDRMTRTLDELVMQLDSKVAQGKDHEAEIARIQFQQRADAALAARRVREVQALEAARAEKYAVDRDRRSAEQNLKAERERLEALAKSEAERQAREAEAARFDEWRRQQHSHLEQVEGDLELVYRVRRSGAASGLSSTATL
jgi:hypothetical protein